MFALESQEARSEGGEERNPARERGRHPSIEQRPQYIQWMCGVVNDVVKSFRTSP